MKLWNRLATFRVLEDYDTMSNRGYKCLGKCDANGKLITADEPTKPISPPATKKKVKFQKPNEVKKPIIINDDKEDRIEGIDY